MPKKKMNKTLNMQERLRLQDMLQAQEAFRLQDMLQAQEAFRLQDMLQAQETSRLQDMLQQKNIRDLEETYNRCQESYQKLVRAYASFGPLEDIIQAARMASQLGEGLDQMMENVRLAIEDRFRLPEIQESIRLIHEFENSIASKYTIVSDVVNQYLNHNSGLQRLIESMRSINTPWLDTENRFSSLKGLLEAHSIGYALRTNPTFDSHLTDRLRIDLGDWRKKIVWPHQIFTDPIARKDFYVERGFNPDLTAFPNKAFEQIVTDAGLEDTICVDNAYYFKPKEEETEREAGFERTNKAHDKLQRFETQIRRFIDERMTEAFGPSWINQQTPGEMKDQWLEKRQKDKDNGEKEYPLIAYADFTDYVKIIIRKDNWEVFKEFFDRKTSVEESFRRLYPIRRCTMHARIITQDDELYLHVETKRIMAAIGL